MLTLRSFRRQPSGSAPTSSGRRLALGLSMALVAAAGGLWLRDHLRTDAPIDGAVDTGAPIMTEAELDHLALLALHAHSTSHDHRVETAAMHRRQMASLAASGAEPVPAAPSDEHRHGDVHSSSSEGISSLDRSATTGGRPPSMPDHAAVVDATASLSLPSLLVRASDFPRPVVAAPTTVAPQPTSPSQPTAPTSPTAEPTPITHSEPTYYRDVAPILTERCIGCHVAGGLAPFALTDYPLAKRYASSIRTAMEERLMPPMPASPEQCTALDDPRLMTDPERQTLIDWVASDTPEGRPEDAPPKKPGPPTLGAPSEVYDIGTDYTPTKAKGLDDYHCFVIDPKYATDVEWRMADIVPSNGKLFHHGILYLIQKAEAASIRQMDAAEPGPGYTCFGGAGVATAPWVVAEAPGAPTLPYPAGSAFRIPAGALVVLQIHYNMLSAPPSPDRSELRVWRPQEPVNKPPRDLKVVNPTFRIPAGDANYTVSATSRIVAKGQRLLPIIEEHEGMIWGVSGHMHLLGKRIKLELLRADGSRQCLLNIPDWNFNWQGNYLFKEPVAAKAGDRIMMTCTWDNSPENQPYVDGKQQAPREVRWGEGTLDEMCLGGVILVDP